MVGRGGRAEGGHDPGRRSEDVGGRGRANFDTMRVFVFEDYDSRIRGLQHTTHTQAQQAFVRSQMTAPGHQGTAVTPQPTIIHHAIMAVTTAFNRHHRANTVSDTTVRTDRRLCRPLRRRRSSARNAHVRTFTTHHCHEPHSQSERNAPAHVEFTTEWGQINVEPAGRKRKSIKRGEGPPVGQRGSSDRRSSN